VKTEQKQKKAVGKTIAVTAFRAAVLYLAYNHFITPRQGVVPRELQKSLWWSVKNAWKMGRTNLRILGDVRDLKSPRKVTR